MNNPSSPCPRHLLAALVIAGCAFSAIAGSVYFIGQNSSYSGDLNTPANWNGGNLPSASDTARFNHGGTLTASSPFSIYDARFEAANDEVRLGVGCTFTVQELNAACANGSRMTVSGGATLNLVNMGGAPHIYFASGDFHDCVFEVEEDGVINGPDAPGRFGYRSNASSNNVFRIGRNASVTLANCMLGEAGPYNGVEVNGATNFTMKGSVRSLTIGWKDTSDCHHNYAVFRDAKHIDINQAIEVGQGAPDCWLMMTNTSDLVTGSNLKIYSYGGTMDFYDCTNFIIGGGVQLNGSLTMKDQSFFHAASGLTIFTNGSMRVADSEDIVFGADSTVGGEGLFLDRVKDWTMNGKLSVGTGSRAEFRACTNVTVTGQLGGTGRLLLDGVSAFHVGGKLGLDAGGDVRIVNSDDVTFGSDSACGGSLLVSNVTAVTIPQFAVSDGAQAVFRDSKVTFTGGVVVNSGSFRLDNLSAGSTYPISVYLNGNGTGAVGAELKMPSDYNPRNIHIGNGANTYMRTLVYDAGGGAFESATMDGFFSVGGNANVTVEMRNGTFTLGLSATPVGSRDPQRYRPTNPNRRYVIGPGATLSALQSRYAPVFVQEGMTGAYGTPIEGIAIIVDGGAIDFEDEATGGYNVGSSGWGYGGIFEAKNGGTVDLARDFVVGAESGIADDCRIGVLSGAAMNVRYFNILTSNNRIVISNGTITARSGCEWPINNSKYPNNAYFGGLAETPRPATNNVIRFEGALAKLTTAGSINSYQNSGQQTKVTLDFAIPENGFAEVPVTATNGITFRGEVRLNVDASAYTGSRRWMTLVESKNSSITIPDWQTFVADVSADCKVRFRDSNHKELQVCVGQSNGFVVLVK